MIKINAFVFVFYRKKGWNMQSDFNLKIINSDIEKFTNYRSDIITDL